MNNEIKVSRNAAVDPARPVILTFVRHYLPGEKSGGPLRSIINMVDQLRGEFDFRIVTSDRDWTDTAPYKNIVADVWSQVGNAQVYYLSPGNRTLSYIAGLLSVTPHDVLYLNSFFDRIFTLKPLWARRLGLSPRKPLVIAPRGEFSPGAFALKYWKKALYTRLATGFGLCDRAIWHASTEHEAMDIRHHLAPNEARQVVVASDIASGVVSGASPDIAPEQNQPRPLRIAFLSRITPKKNLDFALRILAKVQSPVQFNIYGPIGEESYWRVCTGLMEKLPPHITAKYAGVLAHSEVVKVLRAHDLFLFPTHGENFGHVIMESLMAGTPVLIADTTPWQNLEQAGVGWDLPLDSEQAFADKIHIAAQCSAEGRLEWRKRVLSYAAERLDDSEIIAANRRLFLGAITMAHQAS